MTPTTPPASQAPLLRQEGRAATRVQLEAIRAQETAALVREHIPEAVPFIRELYKAGMIAGWRNVHSFKLKGS